MDVYSSMKQNDLIFPCTFVFAQKTSLTGQLLLLLFPCFVSKYGIFSQIKLECVWFTSYTMLELSAASYHTCIFPCHNSPDFRSSLLLSVISNCATLKSVLIYNYDIGYSHLRFEYYLLHTTAKQKFPSSSTKLCTDYWFINACECAGLLYIRLKDYAMISKELEVHLLSPNTPREGET